MNVESVPWLKHGKRRKPLTGILLHHTAGGSAASTIRWLREIGLSYQYVISHGGKVYKCVPVSGRAYHAGWARGKYGRDVNSQTVGIALANYGNGEPYANAQLIALHDLVTHLVRTDGIEWISTHRLVTRRKIDPFAFSFQDFMFSVRKTLDREKRSLAMWKYDRLKRDWDG